MKKTLILGALGSLLAGSGLLFAENTETGKTDNLSYFERVALETQSPRVHARGMDKHKNSKAEERVAKDTRQGYRTVSTHDTVNAFIPYGK